MKITLDLSYETLAGCVGIIRRTGASTRDLKLEEMVAYTLAGTIATYREDGLIPTLSEDLAKNLIEDAYGTRARTHIERLDDNIREQIERRLTTASQEKVPGNVDIHEAGEPEEEPIDLDHPPWRNVERIPFEDIREASPKDILVLQAQTEGDAVLKKALEVGYAQFPMTNWASPQCTKIVAALYKEFGRYEEVIDS